MTKLPKIEKCVCGSEARFGQATQIEKVFLWAHDEAFAERAAVVERAWAALCDKCKEGKP